MKTIHYEIKNGKLIVYLCGEIDSRNVASYKKKLEAILATHDGDVVFDFRETTFIDSSGIGLVLGRYEQLAKEGRVLMLSHLSNTSYKVFELSGLFDIMEVYHA